MQPKVVTDCRLREGMLSMDAHRHSAYEVLYVPQGRITLQVGATRYKMRPHTLAFISAGEVHALEVDETPHARYYALIHTAHVDKMVAEPKLMSVFKNRPVNFYHCFDLSGQQEAVVRIFNSMLREFDAPSYYSDELLAGYIKELLVTAFRTTPDAFPAGPRVNPAVLDVQQYIDRHFTDAISLQELAGRHFLSVDYLSHSFKEYTGHSPQQYILQTRLHHSKELLLTTRDTVNNIAYLSGFSDVNSFIRVFKKYVGLTPNKYRSA